MAINRVEVVINGSILSLQGDASEEHMQKVAKLINETISAIHHAYEKNHLNVNKFNQLLVLNLADECVKTQESDEHSKMALEAMQQENQALKAEILALSQQIAHLKEEKAIPHRKAHINRGR